VKPKDDLPSPRALNSNYHVSAYDEDSMKKSSDTMLVPEFKEPEPPSSVKKEKHPDKKVLFVNPPDDNSKHAEMTPKSPSTPITPSTPSADSRGLESQHGSKRANKITIIDKKNKYGIQVDEFNENGTIVIKNDRPNIPKPKINAKVDLKTAIIVKKIILKKSLLEPVPHPQDITRTINVKHSTIKKIQATLKTKASVALIRFSVFRKSQFNESVHVVGSVYTLGEWNIQKGLKMEFIDGAWEAEALVPGNTEIEYKYVVVHPQRVPYWEAGANRITYVDSEISKNRCVELKDVWQEPEIIHHADQQQKSMLKSSDKLPLTTDTIPTHGLLLCFQLHACNIELKEGQHIAIVGSPTFLGKWDSKKSIELKQLDNNWWMTAIPVEHCEEAFEYKFIVKDATKGGKDGVMTETGPNRKLIINSSESSLLILFCNDRIFRRITIVPKNNDKVQK